MKSNFMKNLMAEVRPAIVSTLVLGAVTCGVYPLVVTGIAQTAFEEKAGGSLMRDGKGEVRGSALIGQLFVAENHFHGRPCAAGAGYDGASSGGSNLGPTSKKLHEQMQERVAAYRAMNGLPEGAEVPADAVTASGSGLDPHISVTNAEWQAGRVGRARGLSEAAMKALVQAHTEGPDFGLLGEGRVNVVTLNEALDGLERGR